MRRCCRRQRIFFSVESNRDCGGDDNDEDEEDDDDGDDDEDDEDGESDEKRLGPIV